MAALAFNQNGDPFDVPPTASGWRVRRMKPRGAPELVYGGEGAPLILPIDADIDALAEAVGQIGRYRLDAVSDDAKVIEGVPPAYVQVSQVVSAPEVGNPLASLAMGSGAHLGEGDAALLLRAVLHSNGEVVRSNTELARSIVDRFPEMLHGTATLIHAADGAGMPYRKPRATDGTHGEEGEGTDEDAEEAPAVPQSFLDRALTALASFGPLIAPLVQGFVANGGAEMLGAKLGNASGSLSSIGLGQLLDWRKAAPAPSPPRAALDAPSANTAPTMTTPAPAPAGLPAIPLHLLPKFGAIVMQLTPTERALVMKVAEDLSATERDAWLNRLGTATAAEALAQIRALIAGGDGGSEGAS